MIFPGDRKLGKSPLDCDKGGFRCAHLLNYLSVTLLLAIVAQRRNKPLYTICGCGISVYTLLVITYV